MIFLKSFLVLTLILGVIGISGCLSSDTVNQPSNCVSTQASSNTRWVALN